MSTTSESCVPLGFRFHPTDEKLVGYYLRKKVASQKIDLDVIRDIDLYRIEPWDFQEKCRIGYEEQNEWYFFSHKDKKYPTGTRTNRATIAGFWKATGRDKAIFNRTKLIGMRKTLVFYKGRRMGSLPSFQETINRTMKSSIERWDSTDYYNEHRGRVQPAITDSIDCTTRQQISQWPSDFQAQNSICNQELEEGNEKLHMVQPDDEIMQLPQLESPSLPLLKRPPKKILNDRGLNQESIIARVIPRKSLQIGGTLTNLWHLS